MSVNQSDPTSYGFSQPLVTTLGRPILAQRDPTDRDKAQFGTIWINQAANNVFMITTIMDNFAHWELLAASAGATTSLRSDDGTIAFPLAGVINTLGGVNMNTTTGTNTIFFNLNDDVSLAGSLSAAHMLSIPDTSSSTVGIIEFGGAPFISDFGTNNTFVGKNSGNVTLTGSNNSGFGFQALEGLTSGSRNSGIGSGVLTGLTTGTDTVAVGYSAGSSYTTESSNIVIGNIGTAADANTLRIGTPGSSSGQINTSYIAGIYNNSVGGTAGIVSVDSTGKLGSSNGTNGQLLIGGGTKPIWANLTSTGGSVTITNGANSINLEASGTAALTSLAGDTGTATPLAGVITLAGDGIAIKTVASSHTVEIEITGGTNGQLLIGATAGSPTWANLASSGGTVTITNTANGINLEASGTPPGLVTLTSQSGVATPVASNINISGTSPINTTASGSTLDVNLTNGTDGQVLIGGGAGPVWNNIVAGSGITIVNSANGIEISATGAMPVAIFSYILAINRSGGSGATSMTPAGGIYTTLPAPNSGTAMTQVFDDGPYINYTTASGACIFTALTAGTYIIDVNAYVLTMTNPSIPAGCQFANYMSFGGTTMVSTTYQSFALGTTFPHNFTTQFQAYFNMGDTATFSFSRWSPGGGGSLWTSTIGATNTTIQGYLLS